MRLLFTRINNLKPPVERKNLLFYSFLLPAELFALLLLCAPAGDPSKLLVCPVVVMGRSYHVCMKIKSTLSWTDRCYGSHAVR